MTSTPTSWGLLKQPYKQETSSALAEDEQQVSENSHLWVDGDEWI